ncbi:2-hydroxyacyl-CoA dehydratase subunit D [Anaerophilus nitritogenes]|uniref:2-hydroxyacyl-CoA dehydratase subunit D n=1 Tax=Anaerophilus nitritogenes TaxID=2498136 RepID=UPI00101C745A|nr:2-hydroxyacyl-CoA dehydratase family protein [Anaerophilus nitritogenes]
MSRIEELLNQFSEIAKSPKKQLNQYLAQGKKAIGCFPYYVPEELVYAADMVPFGIWGQTGGTINQAKEYFAAFYCTIAQLNLEMGLKGTLDGLSGVIASSMCDTLRPFTQNFRVACPDFPFMFLAHPQNRRPEYGVEFTMAQYKNVKDKLEEIGGAEISDESLKNAIKVYNESRAVRRRFVELAGEHPEIVTPKKRNAVLKSAYFMLKSEHTELLKELNELLEKSPKVEWKGTKIVTSGIVLDSPSLLEIIENNNMAIVADDMAHESRAIRVDVPEDEENPMKALALQFAAQDYDTLLYDPEINKRPEYIVNKVKESKADGVVIMMMQFCDPEEIEFPSLKKGLDEAGIPYVKIGMDQQMTNFGQARTSLQAFSDVLSVNK